MKSFKILHSIVRPSRLLAAGSINALQLSALENAANAVVITDNTGRIIRVNNAFERLTGYSCYEAEGRKIGDLVRSGKHENNFYKELNDTINSGRVWKGVIINRRKDGTLYYEEQTITPVADKNGSITHFFSIKEDITEKLKCLQAVRYKDTIWKNALEVSGDGLWDLDLKAGRIFFSDQWKAMLGYSRDEIGDTPDEWGKRIHPDDRKRCLEEIGRHINGDTGIYQNEHRILCKDGTYKWILNRGKVISRDSNGRPLNIVGTHTDITDRKKADDALREKSEEMERFFTVGLDLLCIFDIKGNFTRVNRSWVRTLGHTIEELEGKSFLDFVHPDDIVSSEKILSALSDQIPILNFTNRFRTQDGSYRFIEWRSYPSGEYVYAAARDVTDRIKNEYELNKLAERLTIATESAGIGIWDMDMVKNEFIWDAQMFRLYGIDEDRSSKVYDLWRKSIHPDDREYVKTIFREGVKKFEQFNGNFRVIWPDKSLHHLEAHALVIRDEKGEAVRVTGVTRDVTMSKKMEEKLVALSTTDSLTTACNRRYFLQILEMEINRSARYNTMLSLIMFDIDHFKNINDTYGHDAGDDVLKGIVMMMQKRIRKNDVLARWGGEEFMILLSETGLENSRVFAGNLLAEMRKMVFDRAGSITASFGVTEYIKGDTSDSLLKRVDELVYRAKSEGRNCVVG